MSIRTDAANQFHSMRPGTRTFWFRVYRRSLMSAECFNEHCAAVTTSYAQQTVPVGEDRAQCQLKVSPDKSRDKAEWEPSTALQDKHVFIKHSSINAITWGGTTSCTLVRHQDQLSRLSRSILPISPSVNRRSRPGSRLAWLGGQRKLLTNTHLSLN